MLFFLFALLQGIDGVHVCAALTTSYNMVNSETGQIQFLFPFDTENNKAIVKRISKVKLPVCHCFALSSEKWCWPIVSKAHYTPGNGTEWALYTMGLDTVGLGHRGAGT